MLRDDENCTKYSAVTNMEMVTNRVGAGVPIYPVERSSTGFCVQQGVELRSIWADEDICPLRGPCWFAMYLIRFISRWVARTPSAGLRLRRKSIVPSA